MNNKYQQRQFKRAEKEGRVCEKCGWMISIKNWKKGHRLCAGCYTGQRGVRVSGGWGPYYDEPQDRTGEM